MMILVSHDNLVIGKLYRLLPRNLYNNVVDWPILKSEPHMGTERLNLNLFNEPFLILGKDIYFPPYLDSSWIKILYKDQLVYLVSWSVYRYEELCL